MRIGIACVMQESNSFVRKCVPLSIFSIHTGPEIVPQYQGTNTEVGGFLEEMREMDTTPVPLVSAYDVAAGPVEDGAFEILTSQLLQRIEQEQCDGLLIALHGAWLSLSYDSCDAELMRRVRAKVGPTIPIFVTLDYHANVRPSLLEQIHGLVGYRTYPHTDMGEAGRKAARLLFEAWKGRVRPVIYWLPVPLLAPPQNATTEQQPIKDLMQGLTREFASSDILSTSFFCVQPWLDVHDVGSSLVVAARAPRSDIPQKMQKLAQELWDRRHEFQVDWVAPENLVRRVHSETRRPVIVSEAFDGTSAGAIGDNPGLLSLLLPVKDQLSACLFIVDPKAAEQAEHAGWGGKFRGPVGGMFDDRFGPPQMIEAKVRQLSSGKWVLKGPVLTGKPFEMGLTAVLETGKLKLVVASRTAPMFDPALYRSQGLEPRDYDVVGVKSPGMYRAAYSSLGGVAIDLDMPGVARGNLLKVPFTKINRPIYPLDDFSWDAAAHRVFLSGPGN